MELKNFFDEKSIEWLKKIGDFERENTTLKVIEMLELLPENPNELADRIEREIPDDYDEAVQKLQEIKEKDNEFFMQIVTLFEIVNEYEKIKPKTEKLSSAKLKEDRAEEIFESVMTKIKSKK